MPGTTGQAFEAAGGVAAPRKGPTLASSPRLASDSADIGGRHLSSGTPPRPSYWIDRGGTFTDCIRRDPETGALAITKVLSSDDAPLAGIRALEGLGDGEPIGLCDVRMGTTVATNALLERRGARVGLAITEGFADLLAIGDQTRPDLFALAIERPPPLCERVVEVSARVDPGGEGELGDRAAAIAAFESLRGAVDSIAISVLGGHRRPELEAELVDIARAAGFDEVCGGTELTAEEGLLARTDTAVVDAYLTPLLRRYIAGLREALGESRLLVMQSSGGLIDAARFRGVAAVLSGPAGGVVACARVAADAGFDRAVGFDMGGTSTDVVCIDGEAALEYETEIDGVRLRAPMLAIHTVAAGGGSLCRYRGHRLTVGPESAGASPGPACYGNPAAVEPAITDVNLALGRIAADEFPIPLHRDASVAALERLRAAIPAAERPSIEGLGAGLLEIANANMAAAIRRISVGRGIDVRDFALVVYGGAGGQHACAVAGLLGIGAVVIDPLAGVLSAYGMGLADVTAMAEADGGGERLAGADLAAPLDELERRARAELAAQRFVDGVSVERAAALRYRGTDYALTIPALGDLGATFSAEHERRFGYRRDEALIEVAALRAHARARLSRPERPAPEPQVGEPEPRRRQAMWTGEAMEQVPVYGRAELGAGAEIDGPALVLEETGTVVVDRGWAMRVDGGGRLILEEQKAEDRKQRTDNGGDGADPVSVEIFGNLFTAIARQMGDALRRTAVSTNIRERRDFSCAIFDGGGGLVANAPHIPVHLGAMSETIKALLASGVAIAPGDVFATNDPDLGGSHLPDITVISPVHDGAGELLFFTASRGHHADVGGITPGSMPPGSTTLAEEGAVFSMQKIAVAGALDDDGIRATLGAGPHPARRPDDNVADLVAQLRANRAGANLLLDALEARGREKVLDHLAHIQTNAARRVGDAIEALADGRRELADFLDDGSRIAVAIDIAGRRLAIDFAGSSDVHPGNLNAPRAVTVAAVLYVLRCMVGAPIPLNSGCLEPIDLSIPPGSILDPGPGRAVAGGNVETSQRVVDVLLGALGLAAASQGTMNNLTLGDGSFGYYETIAGGAGATADRDGASAVHTHMTNTRITDPETLEARHPMRVVRFAVRWGSGGDGEHRGGDGVIREIEALAPLEVSILSERRTRAPFGLAGGGDGEPGRNTIAGEVVGGCASASINPGDRVVIETPGGGGFGPIKRR
jgi:5-oxoprolinase (ATP-hydrolysing)